MSESGSREGSIAHRLAKSSCSHKGKHLCRASARPPRHMFIFLNLLAVFCRLCSHNPPSSVSQPEVILFSFFLFCAFSVSTSPSLKRLVPSRSFIYPFIPREMFTVQIQKESSDQMCLYNDSSFNGSMNCIVCHLWWACCWFRSVEKDFSLGAVRSVGVNIRLILGPSVSSWLDSRCLSNTQLLFTAGRGYH